MEIATFNALSPDDAAQVIRPCADIEAWIGDVVEGRPYDDVDALLTFAEAAAAAWGTDEIDAALAQHPRIGERAPGGGAEATMSSDEQSGIADDADAADALTHGNRAYEETFGRIFLIRAAGRSSSDVLEQLTARLDNDPATEDAVVAGQLREIALLRLEGIFTA